MKITSLDKTIGEALALGYYRIPRFQRPFSWEKDQVEEFWEDTIADNETDYFIGSMLVYEENKSKKWLGVVDGQQRLTTITLILCALRNAFDAEGLKDQAEGIQALIERKNIDNKPEYVLQPETSYPYFQEHIQKFGQPDTELEADSEETLLKRAFEIVTGTINDVVISIKNDSTIRKDAKVGKIKDKLIHIRNKILGLNVIHITLDNEDDAYIAFETLNTRGRDLTIADLLKNHLLKLIKPKNANVDVYKEKWASILKFVESAGVKLDEFLYHHWLSKYERYVPAKKLYKSIKREVKSDNAKLYFEELLHDAKLYNSIVKPTPQAWPKNELRIRTSLIAFQIFRIKQQMPMVLAVLRDYKAKKLKQKHVVSILESIECFHFVFSAITSQRSSGGISNMYAAHAIDLSMNKDDDTKLEILEKLKKEFKRRLPRYQEFEANFTELVFTDQQCKQKRLIQYLLAKIDTQNYSGLPVDYEQMTLEHISPQKPKDGSEPSEYMGIIGNLLLVNSKLNQQLSNKSFQKKKEILTKSKISLDEIITDSSTWEDEEIKKRTTFLARKAYEEIWKLQ